MSYEVKSRSEVKERLDELDREYGTDSVDDIRRAHGSHRHRIRAVGDVGVLALDADAAPGQLAAGYDALATALSRIDEQIGVVEGLIRDAGALAHESMHDGHGPIAHAIDRAFKRSAGGEEGTVRALTSYRDELRDLEMAIRQTMTLYQRIDPDLVRHLDSAGERYV